MISAVSFYFICDVQHLYWYKKKNILANKQQFSIDLTLTDHRDNVKISDTLQWNNWSAVRSSTKVLHIWTPFRRSKLSQIRALDQITDVLWNVCWPTSENLPHAYRKRIQCSSAKKSFDSYSIHSPDFQTHVTPRYFIDLNYDQRRSCS